MSVASKRNVSKLRQRKQSDIKRRLEAGLAEVERYMSGGSSQVRAFSPTLCLRHVPECLILTPEERGTFIPVHVRLSVTR